MKPPHKIYMAGINLRGLWSKKPIVGKYENIYARKDMWYDSSGDLCVEKLGLHKENSYITFSSTSKEEVQMWIDGATSVMALLKSWSK